MRRRVAFLALVGAWYIYLAPLGLAAGPKKPAVDFFVGPKLQFMDQLGVGVQGALLDKKHNILFLLDINAVRMNSVHGSTVEDDGRPPHVGDVDLFHVGAHTHGQVGFSILFKAGKPR